MRAYDQFRWIKDSVRFAIVRCGRRWGKTELLGRIGCSDVIKGKFVGYFAPDYKRMLPFYKFCEKRLLPVTLSASQQSRIITVLGDGALEHWTLNDPHAGRSRKYHTVLIDEAAFAGPDMMDVWRNAIKPTLLDYGGRCIVASNTNGISQDQWFGGSLPFFSNIRAREKCRRTLYLMTFCTSLIRHKPASKRLQR